MIAKRQYLALDIGEKRTGVALADGSIRIAVPLMTVDMTTVDFRRAIAELVTEHEITDIVIGYPRNQSGEATHQSSFVEEKATLLEDLDAALHFQDESLTSVIAEERLSRQGRIEKGEIDREAAAIILQDFLEQRT